jgi:hypothetical protein
MQCHAGTAATTREWSGGPFSQRSRAGVLTRRDDRRQTVVLTAAGRRKLMRGAEAQRAAEDELSAHLVPAQ